MYADYTIKYSTINTFIRVNKLKPNNICLNNVCLENKRKANQKDKLINELLIKHKVEPTEISLENLIKSSRNDSLIQLYTIIQTNKKVVVEEKKVIVEEIKDNKVVEEKKVIKEKVKRKPKKLIKKDE